MQRYAVLTYEHAENPDGIPPQWPAVVRPVTDKETVTYPWLLMTETTFLAYRDDHQSIYDAWKYKYTLNKLCDEKVGVLWQSAYDYNFQFFSGGAYSMILNLRLAGSQKAVEVEAWLNGLWAEYYRRRAIAVSAMTMEDLDAISVDFSTFGPPPWTVPQMMADAVSLGGG